MKYNFYSDPGHGWLKVPYEKLSELGVAHKISEYSFRRGGYAYLEEDRDAGIFIKALEAKGEEFAYEEHIADRRSKIRNYPRFYQE